MDPLVFLLAFAVGVLAAFAAGSLSGVRIGAQALGAQLAAYMGGLYGLVSGVLAVTVGLVVLALM